MDENGEKKLLIQFQLRANDFSFVSFAASKFFSLSMICNRNHPPTTSRARSCVESATTEENQQRNWHETPARHNDRRAKYQHNYAENRLSIAKFVPLCLRLCSRTDRNCLRHYQTEIITTWMSLTSKKQTIRPSISSRARDEDD